MFVLEYNLVEVDWCRQCRGVWLDSGELELVSGPVCAELENALMQDSGSRRHDGKRPCPVCEKALLKVPVRIEPPVTVDRCPSRHGIWFDAGELSGVVRAAGQDDSALAGFFRELAD
jgi:hypothetical protein